MEYAIDKSFERDLKKAPKDIIGLIPAIIKSIKEASSFLEIPNIIKLKGYKNAYRIKEESFRLGLYDHDNVVVLSRLLDFYG